jgi:hypothetical protein
VSIALSGQQSVLLVWAGAFSCWSFGHSAWHTPWSWQVKTLVSDGKREPELGRAFSEGRPGSPLERVICYLPRQRNFVLTVVPGKIVKGFQD